MKAMKTWHSRLIPVLITLIVALFVGWLKSYVIAQAFLWGASVVWCGEALFFLMLIKKIRAKRATGFFKLFCVAEFLKLLLYGSLFLLGIVYFHQPMGPVLSGFVTNLILYWFLSCKALGDL